MNILAILATKTLRQRLIRCLKVSNRSIILEYKLWFIVCISRIILRMHNFS